MIMKLLLFLNVFLISVVFCFTPAHANNPLWIEAGGPYYNIVEESIHFYLDIQGGTSPYSVHWNFGDGESSCIRYPDHVYHDAGTYLVTVKVVDHVGTKVVDYTAAYVYDKLKVLIPYSYSAYIGEYIEINCTVSGGKPPYNICWDVDSDDLFDDGVGEIIKYRWNSSDVYRICVKVADDLENEVVGFSNVTVSRRNTCPDAPMKPNGLTRGKINTNYTYTTFTTDPEGNKIYVQWNFGDDITSTWLGPYEANGTISVIHNWIKTGEYEIKVRAKDNLGLISDWSDSLIVEMTKTKHLDYHKFLYGHKILHDLHNDIVSLLRGDIVTLRSNLLFLYSH